MRDTLKQRLFDLGYGTGSKTPLEAIDRIEELELELYEMNALYGVVKEGLEEKLAKAVEALREWDALIQHQYTGSRDAMYVMSYIGQHTADLLAELEGKDET